MTKNKALLLMIIVSILIALAMIMTPYIIDAKGNSQTVIFILFALWFIPFINWIKSRKNKSEQKIAVLDNLIVF